MSIINLLLYIYYCNYCDVFNQNPLPTQYWARHEHVAEINLTQVSRKRTEMKSIGNPKSYKSSEQIIIHQLDKIGM